MFKILRQHDSTTHLLLYIEVTFTTVVILAYLLEDCGHPQAGTAQDQYAQ